MRSGPAARKRREEKTIDACLKLAQLQEGGCLLVIETERRPSSGYYSDANNDLVRRDGKAFSVFDPDDRQAITALASVDGACIVSADGELKHYGATLRHSMNVPGHGKRHAFALGTSRSVKGAVCVLHSEEDHYTRVFRDGLCVAAISPNGRLRDGTRHRLAELLCNPITATLAASGIVASIFTLNPIPAIITISGSSLIVREGFERLKKFVEG
jgi:DNA integrity scanning protein DisA with diadenylate cyclase activity